MRSLVVIALAASGCTDSSTGIGLPFSVQGSAVMVRTSRGLANLDFTSFADTCSTADESDQSSSQVFRFLLTDATADAPPSASGTYQMYSLATLPATGLVGGCEYLTFDVACATAIVDMCASGTVTLTRVDADGYAGSLDVVMASGSHITQTFDTSACPDVSEAGFGTCH
jgi:hypothetical protein